MSTAQVQKLPETMPDQNIFVPYHTKGSPETSLHHSAVSEVDAGGLSSRHGNTYKAGAISPH
jgi:hypothetical protein